MNERIRDLMLEAGYAAPEIAERAQKLAQLIVRECAVVAKKAESGWSDDFAWQAILKHFRT